MVKPRFSFSSAANTPQRVFVDRDDAVAEFEKMRDGVKAFEGCRILNYFGVGGIGKSALRKELIASHLGSQIIAFSMNCRNHENVGAGDSLISLVDSCKSSKQVKFPLFERAYAGYFAKKYPDTASGRERKQFGDRFKIGLDILGLVDGGISNLVTSVADISYDAISKARIPKEIKQDLKNFPGYSLCDIEMRLPAYFAADLENIVEKFGFTPIFFIDTFEAVNEHESRKERCLENEEWARDLVSNVREGLAVIFGRDPLDWGGEWADIITYYRLSPLNNNHSSILLDRLGVKDGAAKQVLLDKANGFPLYLTLLSDTYRLDPQPAEALCSSLEGGSHLDVKILNRFLYNLTDQEAETLRLLSVANHFSRSLLEFAVSKFNTGFSFTHFDDFVSYSFIEPDGDNFFIQRNVRDVVSSSLNSNLRERVHEAFSDYYEESFSNERQYEQLYQMAFHKAHYLDPDSLLGWVSEVICPIVDEWRVKGERRKIYDLLQMLLKTLDLNLLGAPLLSSYTDIVHLGGDYKGSVELIEGYLAGEAGQKLDEDTFLYMQTRKLHHAMFYESAKNLLAEAIDLRLSCGSSVSDAVVELDFLIGGNLSVLAGDFACAKKWLVITREEGGACCTQNIDARIDRKLSEAMLALGELRGVSLILDRYRELMDADSKDLTRYEVYLLGTLGEYYRAIEDVGTAGVCFDKMLSCARDRGMPGWEAHALLALAVLKLQIGDFDAALVDVGKAYALYNQTRHCWGVANSAIVLDALSFKMDITSKAPSNWHAKLSAEKLCQDMGYDYQAQFVGREDLSAFRLLFL